MSAWLVSCVLCLAAAVVVGHPILEDVIQAGKDPRAGQPIKGKYPPIGSGTDQAIYNEGFLEGDIHTQPDKAKDTMRTPVSNPDLLWPSAAVIYKTKHIGCPDSPQCEILMRAMDHYHDKSCIRFKEWTGEANHVEIFFNSDSSQCWSDLGRLGNGVQLLSLGQRCWYIGIVLHELGHTIGFWHEMNRPDRDNYINVYWDNIDSPFSTEFIKHEDLPANPLGEPFDYRSIMMYGEYTFSKDGISPTMEAKTGEKIGPVWKKQELSAGDIRRLRKLYRCDGNEQKLSFPYDISCDFNKDTCGFTNGGYSVWKWRTVTEGSDGYMYSSYNLAGETPGYLKSINLHAVSDKDTRGPLGCVRFYYLLQGDGKSSLQLLHAYLDKVTQLTYDNEKTFVAWHTETVTNEWIQVDVPTYITRPFKLIFYSKFEEGTSYGTIALDDIKIMYSACPDDPSSVKVPLSAPASPLAETTPHVTPTTPHVTPTKPIVTPTKPIVTPTKPIDTPTTTNDSTMANWRRLVARLAILSRKFLHQGQRNRQELPTTAIETAIE